MAFKTCIWQKTTWTVPLPVILSVAFALLGGVSALWLTGMLLDIYAQLELLLKTNYIDEIRYQELNSVCSQIRVMLIKSINTAKGDEK